MPALPLTANVLTNDSHPNGLAMDVTANTQPSNGTLTDGVNPDGSFTYEPNPGFTGIDTFDYTVTDSAGQSASESVVIQVPCCGPDATLGNPLAQYNACAVTDSNGDIVVAGNVANFIDISGNGNDIALGGVGNATVDFNQLDTSPLVRFSGGETSNTLALPASSSWTFVHVGESISNGIYVDNTASTFQVRSNSSSMILEGNITQYSGSLPINGSQPATYVWRINGDTGRLDMYQNGVNVFDTTLSLVGFDPETPDNLLKAGNETVGRRTSDFSAHNTALTNDTLNDILADYQARYPSLPNQTLIV